MNDERIDLSPLDPSLDRPRWERLIDAIARQALLDRRPSVTVSAQLVAWLRPALAMAAGVAGVVWLAAAVDRPPVQSSGIGEDPALATAQWVMNGDPRSPWDLLNMMGADHDTP